MNEKTLNLNLFNNTTTMGAPKGNDFWRKRSKHGRDKIFSNGEMIINACDEYMQLLSETPLLEHDYVGKYASEVHRSKKHVPTWPGFSVFCHVHIGHFQQLRQDYKKSEDPIKKGIYEAVMYVDSVFFHDKFAAASAGLANPSLIGKDLGIKEAVDVTTDGDKLTSLPAAIQVEIIKPKHED